MFITEWKAQERKRAAVGGDGCEGRGVNKRSISCCAPGLAAICDPASVFLNVHVFPLSDFCHRGAELFVLVHVYFISREYVFCGHLVTLPYCHHTVIVE